jgi:hypothetical protein
MATTPTLVFRVTLRPRIWREIEVAGTTTLYKLADAIVGSFNFAFDHAFGFYPKLDGDTFKGPRYELFVDIGEKTDPQASGVERTRAASAFREVGDKMLFLFDYGEEWRFVVELRGRNPRAPGTRLPRVVEARGKAPPQYDWGDAD